MSQRPAPPAAAFAMIASDSSVSTGMNILVRVVKNVRAGRFLCLHRSSSLYAMIRGKVNNQYVHTTSIAPASTRRAILGTLILNR